jgi:hypothetical protein
VGRSPQERGGGEPEATLEHGELRWDDGVGEREQSSPQRQRGPVAQPGQRAEGVWRLTHLRHVMAGGRRRPRLATARRR